MFKYNLIPVPGQIYPHHPPQLRETWSERCTLLYLHALWALALISNNFVLLAKAWPNNSGYKRQTNPGVCNLEKLQKERNLVLISTSAPPLGASGKLPGPGNACKETYAEDVPSSPTETLLYWGDCSGTPETLAVVGVERWRGGG